VEIEHLKATDPDEYEHVYAYASFNLAPAFTALTA
jgi:hypothetical protein